MTTYQVNLVVETRVRAATPAEAAQHVEATVQRLLDTKAKRLHAVVGADYGDITEVDRSVPSLIV